MGSARSVSPDLVTQATWNMKVKGCRPVFAFFQNRTVDERHILKICENYIKQLHDWTYWPENLEIETEEEVDEDKKDPYILHSEVEKAVKEMWGKKASK